MLDAEAWSTASARRCGGVPSMHLQDDMLKCSSRGSLPGMTSALTWHRLSSWTLSSRTRSLTSLTVLVLPACHHCEMSPDKRPCWASWHTRR